MCRPLFRLRETFCRVQLAVALGYADAGGVHVGVEDVGAVLRRLHEALMNGGGVRSLVGGVRRLPGLEKRETWGTRLLVGYFNQGVTPGFCRAHRFCDSLQRGLDQTPSVPAKSHNCNCAVAEILLIGEVFVGRQENIGSGLLADAQQFAVKERAPSLLTGGFDIMSGKRIADADRRSLIE